jgi:allantoicase
MSQPPAASRDRDEPAAAAGTAAAATPPPAFALLPDLAARLLGGSVMWANDEFFADKENLIRSEPPMFTPGDFTHKGQRYDGWETRRRRPSDRGEHDSAIIRLGAPGVLRGIVVDTAFFLGNYPPRCSIEATCYEGYPGPTELQRAGWVTVVPPHALHGGAVHYLPIRGLDRRFTHVRLNMLPDGGIARLRVHGEPVADPAFLAGLTADLAALRDGARITACSDAFYGRPDNLLMPGRPHTMGEGWENARRRGAGNDWVEIALIAEGRPRVLELDTTHFKGNAPYKVRVRGARLIRETAAPRDQAPGTRVPAAIPAGRNGTASVGTSMSTGSTSAAQAAGQSAHWFELLPPTRLQPDTEHRFLLPPPPADSTAPTHRSADSATAPVTHLRIDVYPDGGMARVRVLGPLTPAGLETLTHRWNETR